MVKTPKAQVEQKSLDKTDDDVKQLGRTNESPKGPEVVCHERVTLPPRVVQDMLNHRRMLKGMLEYTEKSLRQAGVKV